MADKIVLGFVSVWFTVRCASAKVTSKHHMSYVMNVFITPQPNEIEGRSLYQAKTSDALFVSCASQRMALLLA